MKPIKTITKDTVSYILYGLKGEDLQKRVVELIHELGDSFDLETGDAIADAVTFRQNGSESLAKKDIAEIKSPTALYVLARHAAAKRDYEDAIEHINSLKDRLSKPNAQILLLHARMLTRVGRMEEAANDLRFSFSLRPPYSHYVKAEVVLNKIVSSGRWAPKRPIKIALLASSTTALLASVLKAICFERGMAASIYQGQYGSYRQEILDPGSKLYELEADVIVIVPNHKELAFAPTVDKSVVTSAVESVRGLWKKIKGHSQSHVIQVGYDIPPSSSWGQMEITNPKGRLRAISKVNELISSDLPSGVSFISAVDIARHFEGEFFLKEEWARSKQYPALRALPLFAGRIAAQIAVVYGLTSKVLVLDLDNTLWGGVVGEDGVANIKIGPPSAEGEAFLEIQRYAKELKDRGILLAVCSKNNLADAQEPFLRQEEMLLKQEDFVMFVANWEDKATNIQKIASTLSLGLDSFVFLDDNPLERAWVRSKLPQVEVPEVEANPWSMLSVLVRGNYFEALTTTEEDARRSDSYLANMERTELEQSVGSLEEFLRSLDMTAEYGPLDEITLPRVAQLVSKTNQFNLTTRRYTIEQLKAMAESDDWWCRWFRLKDRFGDHGLVGVLLIERNGGEWVVDTWLMSCRVLGRQMERFMCKIFLDTAESAGVRVVRGCYAPTPKNGLVKNLYAEMGFVKSNPGEFLYNIEDYRSGDMWSDISIKI